MLDHRYPRVVADTLDQALAATGDDDIHVLGVANQFSHRRPVSGFHHLHGGVRQARFAQTHADALGDGLIGMDGFGAATQDGRIAGFQAQGRRINGHVGA